MKRRKRYYIHGIQKKYAFLTFLLLIIYTFILAIALFLPPALKLMDEAPLEEQMQAASQFIALSDRLWPAILVSLPVFMVLSVLLTHKLAGPVYRLEKSLKQIADGDLGLNVRFRPGDDLQELGVLLNQIIYRQSEALRTVQSVQQNLEKSIGEIRGAQADPERLQPALDQIQAQTGKLESLLRQFKIVHLQPVGNPSEKDPSTGARSA